MDSIKNILTKFDPLEDKYVSREFQTYGIYLAEKLEDSRHKSLYIKLSRDIPRAILEEALRFCVDSKARSKGALFMWKLKELGALKDNKKKAKKKTEKKSNQ